MPRTRSGRAAPHFACSSPWRRRGARAADQGRPGVRRGEPEERARRGHRGLRHARPAPRSPPPTPRARRWPSRSSRARRRSCSSRPTSTGWTISTERNLIVDRHPQEPAGQQPRAGGGQGQRRSARWRSGRASTSPALLGDGRLAVGEVKAVPAGKYAKAALEKLGAWGGVEGKLAQAENVRAALALVARGEAPLGIVYRTDAASDPTRQDRRHLPGRQPPADHLPGRRDQGRRRQRRHGIPAVPRQRRGQVRVREAGLHR